MCSYIYIFSSSAEQEWFVSTWFGNTLWLIALGKGENNLINRAKLSFCFQLTNLFVQCLESEIRKDPHSFRLLDPDPA